MNSKVIKLADLNEFVVNPDYKNIEVSDDEICALVESMASNLGKTVEIDNKEDNCGVVCVDANGNTVLLYPSLQLPGAEEAVRDVADKAIGDTFTTAINGKEITLTVSKLLANRALSVDDELAKACEIEGVETLAQLKEYYLASETAKKKEEATRMLVMEYVQFLLNNSEVDLDEDEITAWAGPEAERVYEEELSFGIDLRFTDDGEMLTKEEALARLEKDLHPQFIANMIQKKFGEELGFVPETDDSSMGNPYDIFMFETLTAKAKEALS